MKKLLRAAAFSSVLLTPLAAFAQPASNTLTRAQVRSELVALERAGYSPAVGPSLIVAEQRMADDAARGNASSDASSKSARAQVSASNQSQAPYFGL